ncbi:MAG: GntR family transcriptional regulator [Rhodospirillales bacterium]
MRDAQRSADAADEAAESLSALVYARLRRALMRAELKPLERLKIREIAQRMGTSETPVREAVMRLANEGAIEIKPRYYVRVRRLSVSGYTEIRDIRMHLEPLAAERALAHIVEDDIRHIAERHAALVRAEAEGDWPTALQTNFDFHFGIYYKAQMPALIELLESLWIRIGPLLSELYPHAPPTYQGRHQHEAVLEALRARDSYALREAVRMDLIEGGRNLCERLETLEKAETPQG